MSFITVASATLPSVPLDFKGNLERIRESIRLAKAQGARLRTGPELEVPGYGCLDHHLEGDTFLHSWEVVAQILNDPICKDMLIDVGMGVRHRNVRYNCRILLTYRKIFMIRPKMSLANDGLYREARHFTAWSKPRTIETYYLEQVVRDITGQRTVPIGDVVLSTLDTTVGCETCEELFTPSNPSTYMGLNGVELILNSSASHAELRKLTTRLNLIQNCSRKLGGIYVYSNATGVDGDARIMYDGSSMIMCNGRVLSQSAQFSLKPVEVITATIDLEEVRSFRSSISRNVQAAAQADFPRVDCDICLSRPADEIFVSDTLTLSREISLKILDPMEEIFMAEAVFLWQYLTRSNAAGYFLALSGGLDSATVALFVFGMAKTVLQSINSGEDNTLVDLRRITGEPEFVPKTPQDIVSRLLHTCYMGTKNSSKDTKSRAQRLADSLGAYHSDVTIDQTVSAHEDIIKQALKFEAKFLVEGGSEAENLAKQNIQARNRMVVAYELAQLSTTARKLPRVGASLLVLSSGNVDETLRGYLTKYDCSSGDIAPLGSISKTDAKLFLDWARRKWDMGIIAEFLDARPSAELTPLAAGEQDDEADSEMGLTYAELSAFGLLRKVEKLGPWSCYLRLLVEWQDRPGFGPQEIATKVIRFFRFYAINRHKSTVITPSVHLSAYNPDDNRHDLRPFLYVVNWNWQADKILEHAAGLEKKLAEKKIVTTSSNSNDGTGTDEVY
ncbi:glutamine-dependent NAD(+) synthetase [Apodospora peruviana]|uniref:Glutamine-dependent NAD(+) synthetase n=1 Tax=Apodospora peruviana TaxID=516989 RepID=A0AAE0ITQ0_9PEZI|nr:glutamine-dependent NAD(+) synthetase [Apodospora peruviana]